VAHQRAAEVGARRCCPSSAPTLLRPCRARGGASTCGAFVRAPMLGVDAPMGAAAMRRADTQHSTFASERLLRSMNAPRLIRRCGLSQIRVALAVDRARQPILVDTFSSLLRRALALVLAQDREQELLNLPEPWHLLAHSPVRRKAAGQRCALSGGNAVT
jgi:hypothetical protein